MAKIQLIFEMSGVFASGGGDKVYWRQYKDSLMER